MNYKHMTATTCGHMHSHPMALSLCNHLHSLDHCTSLHSRHTSIYTPYGCLACAGIHTHVSTAHIRY